MTYPLPFLRLVVSGTLFTSESFSFGISLINDFGTGEAPLEVPQGVIDATEAYIARPTTKLSNAAVLTTIKLNEIGTDGRYTSATDTVLAEVNPTVAGALGIQTPPQIALAVTLRTGARRGLAASGRYYLPSPILALAATGVLDAADVLGVRDSSVTWLNEVNAALPGWDVGVVSDVGVGAQRAVTGVQVGRVYDTIRSRRTSLREQYGDLAPLTGA